MKKLLFLTTLLCIASPIIYGQRKSIQNVESILDKLEKRLLKKEREPVTFGKKNENDETTKFEYKPTYITPTVPDEGKLQGLKRAIDELDTEVERLSGEVQRTKQKILKSASINNMVEITTSIINTDSATFSSLDVELDGHNIYQLNQDSGLWMSRPSVPLYSGPLQPGKHTINFQARIVKKTKDNLPLNNDVFHLINQSFEINVPNEKFHKAWDIIIENPKTLNYRAEAKLSMRDIKIIAN